ncbi:MAG TPA: adenylyl-sulfate kinase [Streptosporangiaceae bacterium]|nr:adenylyl-sulfate kinase [Streptosporangiaceae bacterium]
MPRQESCSEAQLTTQWSSPGSTPAPSASASAAPPAERDLPAELSGWPSCTLDEAQLGDLELITSGAFAPLRGFMDEAATASVAVRGTLADGTPWPVPVTLDVAAAAVPADASQLVLQDLEGSPLAVLAITERLALPGGDPDLVRLAGPVTALREPEHGPFRKLRRRPEDVRAELAGPGPGREPAGEPSGEPSGGNVLAYVTRRPLNGRHIGQLRHYAGQLNARLLVLPLVCGPAEIVTRPESLVRAVLAASQHLPAGTLVVPVPLAPRQAGARAASLHRTSPHPASPHPASQTPVSQTPADPHPDADLCAAGIVAAAYGATHLLADAPDGTGLPSGSRNGALTVPGVPIPVISAGEWAYDPRSEVWRPLALIEPGAERDELTGSELGALLDSGTEVPAWFAPPSVARELRRARPPRAERGLVVFFTGLSGSGKSTIARGLADALSERGDRTVSLLDGDHVRQLLSAGLSFSRADRDLNIARIGYVAAEVARHGGIAICAPIAPYAQARAAARQMVSEVGDFLLVYVSTPVDVCAARDRKGLYAKARAGLITGFTGVSDPYEEPRDADLVLDTSAMTRAEAVDAVLKLLTTGGWLAGSDEPAGNGGATGGAPRASGTTLRIGPPFRKL